MAHCISLDETIPTKSMDIATQNVTHIHYANSQSQTNRSKVGCYQNSTTVSCRHNSNDRNSVRQEDGTTCPNCHEKTASNYYLVASGGSRSDCPGGSLGYICGNCNTHSVPNWVYNHTSGTHSYNVYECPYTAGETLMSISVLHMDKVGARRTLTINFDDQITNAGSVIAYAWNTGATTQSITVNQRGTYYCDVTWQETQSQVNHTVRLTYTF